jgi:hypothetical protein
VYASIVMPPQRSTIISLVFDTHRSVSLGDKLSSGVEVLKAV